MGYNCKELESQKIIIDTIENPPVSDNAVLPESIPRAISRVDQKLLIAFIKIILDVRPRISFHVPNSSGSKSLARINVNPNPVTILKEDINSEIKPEYVTLTLLIYNSISNFINTKAMW